MVVVSETPARKASAAGGPRVPTEQEVLDVLDAWEDGAAYRKARHAANVGACYSTETICRLHDHFANQRLTDDLVRNRLAYAEFSAAELNPTRLGAPSVCEHVSVPVLNRLLRGMRGAFTPDEAHHFVDYHIEDCDAETLRLVADKTGFTRAERREFFELTDWMVNPEFAPGAADSGRTDVARRPTAQGASRKRKPKGPSLLDRLAAALTVPTASKPAPAARNAPSERYPDLRSDFNRRVWADGHNWEADGDSDHNWEADGDLPW